jgi:hypothetical protein
MYSAAMSHSRMVPEAALQHDRLLGRAEPLQQGVVLHVARADLQDVGILGHHGQRVGGHHLGDDLESGLLAGQRQQLQPFLAQPLELVGAGSRLPRPAAEERGPGLLHRPRGLEDLVLRLHRAGAGHDDDGPAAHLHAGHVDDGVLLLHLAGDQLEGLGDAQGLRHAREHGEVVGVDCSGVPHHRHHAPLDAGDGVRGEAQRPDLVDDAVELGLGGVRLHGDEHGDSSAAGAGCEG